MQQELAPGATGQIRKLMEGKQVRCLTLIRVPDELQGYAYQNVELTIDGDRVVYRRFVADTQYTVDQAINRATEWIDENYYGMD